MKILEYPTRLLGFRGAEGVKDGHVFTYLLRFRGTERIEHHSVPYLLAWISGEVSFLCCFAASPRREDSPMACCDEGGL